MKELIKKLRAAANTHPLDVDLDLFNQAADAIEALKTKHDAFDLLESECWDVRCISLDDTWMWQIVGHYMGKNPYRTLGESWEGDGLLAAVDDAKNTTKHSQYDYKYRFTD